MEARVTVANASKERFGKIGTAFGNVQSLPKNAAEAAARGGWPVWWRCGLCPFVVCDESTPTVMATKHADERRRHLRQEHGAVVIPPLPRHGLVAAAKAAEAWRVTFDQRWKAMWARYQENRWQGGHDLEEEPTRYVTRPGIPGGYYYHECKNCGKEVNRREIPISLCREDDRGGIIPTFAFRREQWTRFKKEHIAAKTTVAVSRRTTGKISKKESMRRAGEIRRTRFAEKMALPGANCKEYLQQKRRRAEKAARAAAVKMQEKGGE